MHLETHGLTADDAPTLVLSSGLGGVAGFWQPQLAALTPHYRVVTYDQRGTGRSADTLPEGYTMAMMAAELAELLAEHDIHHYDIVGHALGGLIGLQLALDYPERVGRVVVINGWLSLDAHTQRCFQVRQDLLLNVGVEAFVRAQPLFLYPAEWLARNQTRINAEDAHHVMHFQGMENLLRRLHALMSCDFRPHAKQIAQPVLVICSQDDLLVPWSCSPQLAQALPNSSLIEMAWGGHAMSVTDADNFNALLLEWLAETASSAQHALS
ncbi:pyrimidine utilization protein D [Pantoea rodasii]|uniref:Putative carbamate hydrolase RutD n=1 Tax=Pantoea rodasii TaxID=1076549 RepID=A0A2M9WBP7_9GAMM|nr:pyrimidine utilization protein D [Pantoea rodasii]ORM64491.1 pyrimidine utilization protein D [Pantoea rodasii]PJZ04961.1 pyrimidine utilization protein D [Pantoea rodasii]